MRRSLARLLSLLPLRGLLHSLTRFVELAMALSLLAPHHRLVLVLQLVGLQLEEVREVLSFRVRLLSAPTALLLTLCHLHFAERLLGALQMGERALLRPQRIVGLPLAELLLCRGH